MKPLSNMQVALDIVIVAIGLAMAFWIFSKGVLNLVLASNHWIHAAERSDEPVVAAIEQIR